MRFTLKTLVVLLTVGLISGAAEAVWAASFTASLDRNTLTLGESATLSLTFEGGKPSSVPAPQVPGLQIDQAGQSENVSIVNRAISSTLTVTFVVTPQRAGEFTLPALAATLNNQPFSTRPVKLTVTKGSAPSAAAVKAGNEMAFLKLVLPKTRLYVGESLAGRLELYLRDDIQNFGNFRLSALSAEGFSVGKIIEGPHGRVQIGSHAFTVIPLLVPLTDVQAGRLTLGPANASVVIVLNQGGDPFFQVFNQGQQKQIPLMTEAVPVESLPLPAAGRPRDFNGLLAEVAVSVGPTNLLVGDPVTVRVQISGCGPIEAIQLPAPLEVKGFKVFQSSATVTNLDPLGVQKARIFELVAAPQNADVREWPELPFTCNGATSRFDLQDGTYHQLAARAVPLTVKAAGATPLPMPAASKNAVADNQSPQDLLPLKDRLGPLTPAAAPLVTQPSFLALQSLPVLAFFAALIWRKRADHLANNPRRRRQRAVALLIRGGLADLNKFATENNSNEFFAMLFRLLQEQLGERLACPATAITEADVDKRLIYLGARPATLEALRDLFQLCNQARYAPIQTRQELITVAAKFKNVVSELQNLKA